MDTEPLLIKIGFEYPESHVNDVEQDSYYSKITKKTDETERKIIKKLLQLNQKTSGEALIAALFSGLLCKLSYSKEMDIGILMHQSYQNIHFTMDEHTTLQQAGELIHHAQETEPAVSGKIKNPCRYVIAFQEDKKNIEKKFDPGQTTFLLNVSESEITFYFSGTHFHKQHIERISAYLKRLFKNASLQKPLGQLQMMSKEEGHRLKFLSKHNGFNQTNEWMDKSICHHFKQQVKKNINKIAVKDDINSYTYLELDALSDNLAHTLKKLNIKQGDFVATLIERNANLLVVMMAILKLGAAIIPINEKYPNDRIESILEDSKPALIIVNDDARIQKKYPHLKLDEKTLNDSIHPNASHNEILTHNDAPHHIAYVIYTSGTTGKPKGVPVPQTGLLNLTYWYQMQLKVAPADRASQFASQAFDTFFCETIPFLLLGGSTHIIDDANKLNPVALLDWLKKEKISICDLPTAYAVNLFNLTWPELPQLRLVKIGGEAINQYPANHFAFDIWNTYGPTETAIEASYFKIHTAHQPPSTSTTPPPIGQPITGNQFFIVDAFMQPVPEGIQGELLIHSPGLSTGYINQPELTAKKFIPFTFEGEEKRVYRTGDLVRWQPDGNLEFLGRTDHQVKIRGFRIELSEIEQALSQFSDVQEALVVLKEHGSSDKKLASYIIPNLERMRFPFQERALLSFQNQRFEVMSDDISKHGIGVFGVNKFIPLGSKIHIQIKLPGMHQSYEFNGRLVWQREMRLGIELILTEEERKYVEKSIDYYLSTQNRNELILKTLTKRNLKLALKRKLPDYMIPNDVLALDEFPLNFNGKIDLKALPDNLGNALKEEKDIDLPATPLEQQLIDLWKKVLKLDRVGVNDHFFEIGGNSLLAAQLTVEIVKTFNVTLPSKIMFDMPFIPIMAEFIQSHMKDGKGKENRTSLRDEFTHDYYNDLYLPESIHAAKGSSVKFEKPEHIVLTGCSGFLGVHLLNELLHKTSAKIYCFIRANEFETTASRFLATLKKFGLEKAITLDNRRIILVQSDISLPHFGLADDFYQALSEKIDTIYHCGAQVNTMASYQQLRGSNVLGTLEIIKFATHKKNKAIHYISTLSSAYLKNNSGALVEAAPTYTQHELVGGYAISKWVAELLLTQLNERGVPTTIYRSGYISGDSKTGITNLNDALLILIKGSIQMGYAPKWKENITLLPVDFVSQSIVSISLNPESKGRVFHIDHPRGIKWCDLVEWLNQFGFKIKLINVDTWQKKLKSLDPSNALYAFIPHYLGLKPNDQSAPVSTKEADSILKKNKIFYPEIDDDLLSLYMNQLIRSGFLPETEYKKSKAST